MNNFLTKYEKILDILKQFETKSNFLNQIRRPRLSDIELIALDITAESLSIDSEYQLFRTIPSSLSSKIERSVYNRRRRRLFFVKERIRKALAEKLTGAENYFIVDSMPLEICKLSRSSRTTICKEDFLTSPSKGYCASQKLHFYGYKLHAVCSSNGVFTNFELTQASVHDIHFLKSIKTNMSSCVLIGDKGYLSADYQLDLFTSNRIRLEVPMRVNQHNYQKQPYLFRKTRKRIETLFSQLCDQFMIRRNYAKSFDGYKTRILSKITAVTVIQMINKLLNRNINNSKSLVV
ncbi:MAG: IS982 family transposase [Paludibacter sp.]|nr:IS982 family transposase [Paludibacter sp.]